MVEEAHLWLDSGKVFGPATAQFERFNLACPRATVVKAMEQLKVALDKPHKVGIVRGKIRDENFLEYI